MLKHEILLIQFLLFAVSERFHELENTIDLVIFDTATPSLLDGSIYIATDGVLYPTTCEYLSFDGLVESIKHRQAAEAHRTQWGLSDIQVLGIVPTMYRTKTLEHSEKLEAASTAIWCDGMGAYPTAHDMG